MQEFQSNSKNYQVKQFLKNLLEECIIAVGSNKAGKTTFINLLQGYEIVQEQNKSTNIFQLTIKNKKKGSDDFALNKLEKQNIYVYDGLELEHQNQIIPQALILNLIIKKFQKTKILIFIDIQAQPIVHLKNLSLILSLWNQQSLEEFRDNFFLIVSKVQDGNQDQAQQKVDDLMKSKQEDPKVSEFIRYLKQRNHIIYFITKNYQQNEGIQILNKIRQETKIKIKPTMIQKKNFSNEKNYKLLQQHINQAKDQSLNNLKLFIQMTSLFVKITYENNDKPETFEQFNSLMKNQGIKNKIKLQKDNRAKSFKYKKPESIQEFQQSYHTILTQISNENPKNLIFLNELIQKVIITFEKLKIINNITQNQTQQLIYKFADIIQTQTMNEDEKEVIQFIKNTKGLPHQSIVQQAFSWLQRKKNSQNMNEKVVIIAIKNLVQIFKYNKMYYEILELMIYINHFISFERYLNQAVQQDILNNQQLIKLMMKLKHKSIIGLAKKINFILLYKASGKNFKNAKIAIVQLHEKQRQQVEVKITRDSLPLKYEELKDKFLMAQ